MAEEENQATFAFDLFSDVAPILALFGDEFARQFASESLTWVDHLIIAMVPLGILTIITGAIRVQGPKIAKSFIGRGRENRALAEIELMSSTSKEVCELFNGKSIIRLMGKPRLAQILVFPGEYKTLAKEYEERDRDSLKANTPAEFHVDLDCGIHSLETAIRNRLMKRVGYHSHSYLAMVRATRWLWRCFIKPFKRKDKSKPKNRPQHQQTWDLNWLGPPNLQLGLSSNQYENRGFTKRHEDLLAAIVAVFLQASLLAIATVTVYHGRTRRAISFEPENYGYPCYVIGTILLCIGVGTCAKAIERNTTEFSWQVRGPDPKGEPTSNSEIPLEYKPKKETCPRLFWLQASQEVSDQAFDGYAILAGPKYQVVTSSRLEDAERASAGEDLDSSSKLVHQDVFPFDTQTTQPPYYNDEISVHAHSNAKRHIEVPHTTLPVVNEARHNQQKWAMLTVCAVVAAGLGFIAQFMGLRGLPYPCSIAQLIAILLMALVRAMVRRRLGIVPAHCLASRRYELDFLATRIVHESEFREYFEREQRVEQEKFIARLNMQKDKDVFRFEVKTAREDGVGTLLFSTPTELRKNHPATETSAVDNASTRQLLRVRERLGNLTKWPSQALESTQALVESIKAFMELFPPDCKTDLDWIVETAPLDHTKQGIQHPDLVAIPIQHSSDGWSVAIGKIDAIISLWMAKIEAQSSKTTGTNPTSRNGMNSTDWRHSKPGVDLRYDYSHIIGDDFEDGVLKRDLSWWVDKIIADSSDPREKQEEDSLHNRPASNTLPRWQNNKTVDKPIKLTIGFNGPDASTDKRRALGQHSWELVYHSNGLLPRILARHLFTSFMWTVVEHLPIDCLRKRTLGSEQDVEIENRHTFDPHEFADTWHRPTLRHRKLTKLIRQLEALGLGSQNEILLCMIPAFSFKDLLPNHVILKLFPDVRYGQGWAEIAGYYCRLLEQRMRVASKDNTDLILEEKFCLNVVVAAIDFLCFATEPYDKDVPAPEGLRKELEDMAARLVSSRFAPTIKRLAPAYILQRRQKEIATILGLFATEESLKRLADNKGLKSSFGRVDGLGGCLETLISPLKKLNFDFLEKKLGFSKRHRPIYKALSGIERQKDDLHDWSMGDMVEKADKANKESKMREAKTPDIFEWTPLHYAPLVEDRTILERHFNPQDIKDQVSLNRIIGQCGRSPIHIAAISKSAAVVDWIKECLDETDLQNALQMAGLDGMTPLHLATKHNNSDLIDILIDKKSRFICTTKAADIWKRQAIHLAAKYTSEKVVAQLLNGDAQIDTTDETGNTPLEYLLKNSELWQEGLDQKTTDGENLENHPNNDQHSPNSDLEVEKQRKRKIIANFATKRPDYRDDAGRTYLHYAVEQADITAVERLLEIRFDMDVRDADGKTPLHLALIKERHQTALELLNRGDGLSASPSAKTNEGYTPLMYAAIAGYRDIVEYLVGLGLPDPDEQEEEVWSEPARDSRQKNSKARQDESREISGPRARTLDGRTALHLALESNKPDVAIYLLKLDGVQINPKDGSGCTLLLTACQNNLRTDCIDSILEKWPNIINEPDTVYGQTPLSWACESGYESIVELLLSHKDVNVNIPASEWGNRTPLHLAVSGGYRPIVEKLLSNKAINIDAKDSYNRSAIDLAIVNGTPDVVRSLLVNDLHSDEVRTGFLVQACSYLSNEMQALMPDVLEQTSNEELTDTKLIKLLELSEDLDSFRLYNALVERAFNRDSWKEILTLPFHQASRVGRPDIVERLLSSERYPPDVDGDGWSFIDYAQLYNPDALGDTKSTLERFNKPPLVAYVRPNRTGPESLVIPKFADKLQVSACKEQHHEVCNGVNVIKFSGQDEGECHGDACIRGTQCVPPFGASEKSFYFEVTILDEAPSKILSLGFCNKRYPSDQHPGLNRNSWAYHGDDGALFIKNRIIILPNEDFGTKGQFHTNDTAGVGLNLETGAGFVTLNGERREIGDIFKNKRFNHQKMYPCVGIDASEDGNGLRFILNFGGSTEHAFKYQGPYEEYQNNHEDR